jgi:hypothetical protein
MSFQNQQGEGLQGVKKSSYESDIAGLEISFLLYMEFLVVTHMCTDLQSCQSNSAVHGCIYLTDHSNLRFIQYLGRRGFL